MSGALDELLADVNTALGALLERMAVADLTRAVSREGISEPEVGEIIRRYYDARCGPADNSDAPVAVVLQ